MASWDGSRKRKRSPQTSQGYDDPTKALIFDETKLTLEEGKTVDCQFSFSRQACPAVVTKLLGVADQQDPVRLFTCPRPVGALWIKAMLTKGQELIEKCQELTKAYRTDDRYSPAEFHLEFHLGRRQISRSSHSHIILPVSAYYQFRLRHFKALRASPSLPSDVASGLFFEHWPRYYDGRRRYLEDLKAKHRSYQREDEETLNRLLRSLEPRADKKQEKSSENDDEKTVDKSKTASAEQSKEDVNGTEGSSNADEPTSASEDKAAESAKSVEGEPMDVTTAGEPAAASAEASSEEKKEETPMETDASTTETKEASESQEAGPTDENKSDKPSDAKSEPKPKIPLSTTQSTTAGGLQVEYTFDEEQEGNPSVVIVFVDIPSLTEASKSQVESIITALSDLCEEWRFHTICSLFATTSNRFRIVVDVNSFVRHLSPDDVKVWAERWRANANSVSPTARATREDLDAIEKNEPGSLILEDWSDY